MLVMELMGAHTVSVAPGDTVRTAARLLSLRNVGALPVAGADGMLKGIVTDRDLVLRCMAAGKDPDRTPVRDVMTRGVCSISPHDEAERAAALMARQQVRRLPVAEGGRLVGMLSLSDLSREGVLPAESTRALREISSGLRRL